MRPPMSVPEYYQILNIKQQSSSAAMANLDFLTNHRLDTTQIAQKHSESATQGQIFAKGSLRAHV